MDIFFSFAVALLFGRLIKQESQIAGPHDKIQFHESYDRSMPRHRLYYDDGSAFTEKDLLKIGKEVTSALSTEKVDQHKHHPKAE